MEFKYLTDEQEYVLDLINKTFNTKANIETFKLLDNQKILLLKDNNIIVATVLITLKKDPIKNTKSYYLDYICVKEEYRHKGLGKKLLEKIEEIAINEKIDFIELTSKKERVAARNLYQQFGMSIKDTDIFIKKL